jgi:hypothetical protein
MKLRIEKKKLFYFLISIAIVIFVLSSNPTPKLVSLPILVSGLFLILSVFFFNISIFKQRDDFWTFLFLLFFLFFLTFPNFIAFLRDNLIKNIVRDFLPLLFLFLFILWSPIIKLDSSGFLKLIVKVLAFVGLVYSIKYLALQDLNLKRFTVFQKTPGYLSHDPSVLFSAIYFSIEGLRLFYNKKKIKSLIFSFLGVVCFLPLITTGFRLQIFLYIFFYLVSLLIYFWYMPKKFFFYIIIFLCILIPMHEYLINYFLLLIQKSLNIGFNNRFEEFLVLKEVSNSYTYLIGNGWGSLFSTVVNSFSPVGFVHNFSLYFFYKAGFIGLFFSFLIIFFSFRVLLIFLINHFLNLKLNFFNKNYPIVIATLSCLIYCFFFSGAFKSLSMGLLMVIVSCFYICQKYNKIIF